MRTCLWVSVSVCLYVFLRTQCLKKTELVFSVEALEFSCGCLDVWLLLKSQKTWHLWLVFPHSTICLKCISNCPFLKGYTLSTLTQASSGTHPSFLLLSWSQEAWGFVASTAPPPPHPWRPRAETLEFKGYWSKSLLWHLGDSTAVLSLHAFSWCYGSASRCFYTPILPSTPFQILALLPYMFCSVSSLYFASWSQDQLPFLFCFTSKLPLEKLSDGFSKSLVSLFSKSFVPRELRSQKPLRMTIHGQVSIFGSISIVHSIEAHMINFLQKRLWLCQVFRVGWIALCYCV